MHFVSMVDKTIIAMIAKVVEFVNMVDEGIVAKIVLRKRRLDVVTNCSQPLV